MYFCQLQTFPLSSLVAVLNPEWYINFLHSLQSTYFVYTELEVILLLIKCWTKQKIILKYMNACDDCPTLGKFIEVNMNWLREVFYHIICFLDCYVRLLCLVISQPTGQYVVHSIFPHAAIYYYTREYH